VLSVAGLVHDFAERLRAAVELATVERGEAMIARMFSEVVRAANSRSGKAAKKQADRERNHLVAQLTQEFLDVIEQPVHAHVRGMLASELAGAPLRVARAHAGEGSSEPTASAPAGSPTRRRTRRLRPNPRLPPPLDPEQIKRDQEFARLRALLRPVAAEPLSVAPVVEVAPTPAPPPRAASPGETLRALEKEIQNAVPTLGTLGPERCGAQIAAWVGQVRGLRDRLSPEVSAAMRPAFRIFLEHLTELRMQMEAHIVDALEPKWKAPDWDAYVEVNRARAEQRAPELSSDHLQMHYRAMLRALVLPHRRNVPEQAMPIITSAAEVLHPSDSLLQSAVRRHSAAWKAPASSAPAEPSGADAAPVAPVVAENVAAFAAENPATPPAQDAGASPVAPVTSENEFDSLWAK
jgi:hypothetical protein